MTNLPEKRAGFLDVTLIKLAREIAMDIRPLDELLEIHGITPENWQKTRENPHFQELLRSAVEEWNSAGNTPERVKIKSLAFVEEALPEFYARIHDQKEPLSAKVELLKTVSKLGGIGGGSVDGTVAGERFSVTINLGSDHMLRIEKTLPDQVIDHEDVL